MNIKEFNVAMENMIFNQKDYVQYFYKWKPGANNILYITGYSGSGKSTLSKEIAKKYNAIVIEIDIFEWGHDSSGVNIINKCKAKFPDYKKGLESKWKNPDGSDMPDDDVVKLINKAANYALSICKKDNKNLYIFEGLQIFRRFNPSKLKSAPMIIKGTSALVSEFRALKRGLANNKMRENKKRDIDIVKGHLKSHLPMNVKDDRRLNKFKERIQSR